MKNFIGEKYNRLTVLDRSGDRALCRCDCGNEANVRMDKIRRGETKSCGCLAAELAEQQRVTATVGTPGRPAQPEKKKLRPVWQAMWARCSLPVHKDFASYGGRGIGVAQVWDTFDAFYAWSMANGYSAGLWLERINNDRGYSPENCTWTTPKSQARNRRNTRWITDGTTERTLPEVAERLGIVYITAYNLHRKLSEAGQRIPHLNHFLAIATKKP